MRTIHSCSCYASKSGAKRNIYVLWTSLQQPVQIGDATQCSKHPNSCSFYNLHSTLYAVHSMQSMLYSLCVSQIKLSASYLSIRSYVYLSSTDAVLFALYDGLHPSTFGSDYHTCCCSLNVLAAQNPVPNESLDGSRLLSAGLVQLKPWQGVLTPWGGFQT